MTTTLNGSGLPPRPLPSPRIREHAQPSLAVVVVGSAAFVCVLVGSTVGWIAYRIVESLTGRKPSWPAIARR